MEANNNMLGFYLKKLSSHEQNYLNPTCMVAAVTVSKSVLVV